MLTSLRRSPRAQRGLSLVELMVGVTVGLFVTAAAGTLVATQLASNRRLLLDTQLQQDLRATADIVARELRRSGALRDGLAQRLVWTPTAAPFYNLAAAALTPQSGNAIEVDYQYQRTQDIGAYGFQLSGTKIRANLGSNTWQDLTDDTVMRVTAFTITTSPEQEITVPCPNDCPSGGQACWPKLYVRNLTVNIDAEAQNDHNIQRSIHVGVRVRSDWLKRDAVVTSGMCPP